MRAATSPASAAPPSAPMRVVVVTLDRHLNGVMKRAAADLARQIPGLSLTLHAATDWADDRAALARCIEDIGQGDIIVSTMLFMEDHVRAVLPALEARREQCDAMIGVMSAGEVIRLTKLGPLRMDGSDKGPLADAEAPARRPRRALGRKRVPAPARWPCCAACPSSCASSPARLRISGPISSPCNTGCPARRTTSRPWSASWWAATPTAPAACCAARSRRPRPSNIPRSASTTPAPRVGSSPT